MPKPKMTGRGINIDGQDEQNEPDGDEPRTMHALTT